MANFGIRIDLLKLRGIFTKYKGQNLNEVLPNYTN